MAQSYFPFHGGLHEQEIARAEAPQERHSSDRFFLESFLNMAFS